MHSLNRFKFFQHKLDHVYDSGVISSLTERVIKNLTKVPITLFPTTKSQIWYICGKESQVQFIDLLHLQIQLVETSTRVIIMCFRLHAEVENRSRHLTLVGCKDVRQIVRQTDTEFDFVGNRYAFKLILPPFWKGYSKGKTLLPLGAKSFL